MLNLIPWLQHCQGVESPFPACLPSFGGSKVCRVAHDRVAGLEEHIRDHFNPCRLELDSMRFDFRIVSVWMSCLHVERNRVFGHQ